jgi:hypothetical protein
MGILREAGNIGAELGILTAGKRIDNGAQAEYHPCFSAM